MRMATLSDGGRITEDTVDSEWKRLVHRWHPDEKVLLPYASSSVITNEKWNKLDLFDRCQLEKVIEVCKTSKSLADASRKLFSNSILEKKSCNDSDRLRKYLAKFGLCWKDFHS